MTRRTKDGQDYIFVLNHNDEPATIDLGSGGYTNLLDSPDKQKPYTGSQSIGAKDVWILKA
ncbi:Beta-galactosidase C-terminal domain [Paenibacillus sp. P26]|nr:Beta-galactosidase C-terminal domain [Paenibacillus sp. P26]